MFADARVGKVSGMGISDEKYVALTTYKRDGGSSSTPVWIVPLADGKLGFTTSSSSLKVKRLANDDRIMLQPSDAKGNVKDGAASVSGTAVAVQGAEFDAVRSEVKAKYGVVYYMMTLVGKGAKLIGKGSGTDTAIIVTPSS